MTALTLQSIRVGTASADEDGRLVLADGRLVAVLVRLDDPVHEEARGRWYLEAGFGRCAAAQPEPFADLEEAEAWVAARIVRRPARTVSAASPPPARTDGAGNSAGDGVGLGD